MKTLSGQGNNVTYAYSGLGDRLRETVNGNPTTFTMDLNTGLTQALSDGAKSYIYGNGRIAQVVGTGTEYFLGDALGSVRQLTNNSGVVTYARAYDPYGAVRSASGVSSTAYGYTGEFTDSYINLLDYDPGYTISVFPIANTSFVGGQPVSQVPTKLSGPCVYRSQPQSGYVRSSSRC